MSMTHTKKTPKPQKQRIKKQFTRHKERIKYIEIVHTRLSRMRRRVLLHLSEAQGHRCAYCCVETWHRQTVEWDWESKPWGPKANDTQATLEHFRPECREEQTNQFENLIMSCNKCNQLRGTMNPYRYYQKLRCYTTPNTLTEPKVTPKKLTAEQQAKLPEKLGRQLALGIIAWHFWPEECEIAMDIPSDWLTRKERKRLKNRNFQINQRAWEVAQDPRRQAA